MYKYKYMSKRIDFFQNYYWLLQIYANCDFLFSEEIKTTKNLY